MFYEQLLLLLLTGFSPKTLNIILPQYTAIHLNFCKWMQSDVDLKKLSMPF